MEKATNYTVTNDNRDKMRKVFLQEVKDEILKNADAKMSVWILADGLQVVDYPVDTESGISEGLKDSNRILFDLPLETGRIAVDFTKVCMIKTHSEGESRQWDLHLDNGTVVCITI